MTKKILHFVLLSVLIMSVGYDIQTGRIQFGSSRINDSTSTLMTMNKGALINGDIRSKTDIYIPESEQLSIGENVIKGIINNMQYNSTTHTFLTQSGQTIATLDSASGITFAKDFIPTWTKNNSTRAADQYEKTKIVGFKCASSVSSTTTAAHGITDWRTIKSWTVLVRDSAAKISYSTGANVQYAAIDSLNCSQYVCGTCSAITSDSIFFRIVYTDFQR